MKKTVITAALALAACLCAPSAGADEFLVNVGGGPQPKADHGNWTVGMDYTFFRFERSPRQHISVGVGLTYIGADSAADHELYALSFYPQLTLFADERSWGKPFFFVRALGPSYISSNRLGERQQAEHFSFQAQVGFGFYFDWTRDSKNFLSVSWKHFSNADHFDDNDGFDLPVVISLGTRF